MTYYTEKALKVANFVLRNADGDEFSKEIQAIENALYEARLMGVKEAMEYMDKVYQHFSSLGVVLTNPGHQGE